jgi:hypothetical protein
MESAGITAGKILFLEGTQRVMKFRKPKREMDQRDSSPIIFSLMGEFGQSQFGEQPVPLSHKRSR